MTRFSSNGLAFILCTLALAGAAAGPAQAAVPPAMDLTAARAGVSAPAKAGVLQLVAPIALYPDALVAQILTAAGYPAELEQASSWMRGNPQLAVSEIAMASDLQPWDASVKAIVQFPAVLQNMATNLAWTSALGDAYRKDPQGVLDAVQVLRQRARAAGKLQSTSEQTVMVQGPTIAIEPADPDFVYLPAYDPWQVYGAPIAAYPGWVDVPGAFYSGADLYFGDALDVGLLAGFGWGWNDWGFDWHDRRMVHDHENHDGHGEAVARAHEGMHDHVGGFPGAHENFAPGGLPGRFAGEEHASIAGGFHGEGHGEAGFHGGMGHLGMGGEALPSQHEERASAGGELHLGGGMGAGFHGGGHEFGGAAHGIGGIGGGGHEFGGIGGGGHEFGGIGGAAHAIGGIGGGGHEFGGIGGGGHVGGGFAFAGGGHAGGGFGGGGHGGGGHGGGGGGGGHGR
ncbi:DUF3300 domain-containing protein [Ramlibacter sp.]|uniref:DUF3300 domain-containing protein n=1 Tax=Ramlibacter sp. TaxID=1917967 RepID=UPI0026239409|nr:DUF3300 domain-containing protein [Ramlibacter sp.]MDB5955276.1 sbcC [Ramlibacter sp.]